VHEHGVTTSLEAIARDAGVRPTTLYRHFPDRESLLAEVLRTEIEELIRAGERVARDVDPAGRLDAWMGVMEDYIASYRGLSGPLIGAIRDDQATPLSATCAEMIAITERFVAEAQAAGLARTDVTAHDLIDCASMLAWLGTLGPEGTREATGERAIVRRGTARTA
jgi:AcrR family transcriptional regulator